MVAWYRLSFHPSAADDLSAVDIPMAQRLFDKTKWLASNTLNLRHEPVSSDLPGLCKYSVGEWRIFYEIDQGEQTVIIYAIVRRSALRA